MAKNQAPLLTRNEISEGIRQAERSDRRRFPKLLHKPGDYFNAVFNFIMCDSYMQPHLHPGNEKIEHIYIVEGRVAALFFDDKGNIKECTILESGGSELIVVPAFKWHTYVMLSDHAVTYETMTGVYKPETWKRFANWAPQEGTQESIEYRGLLQQKAETWCS